MLRVNENPFFFGTSPSSISSILLDVLLPIIEEILLMYRKSK
jgi:hypothetical protein